MTAPGDPRAAAAWAALAAGQTDAASLFASAIAAAPHDPELLIGQAEALLAADAPDPLAHLSAAAAANPGWVRGQSALAAMRFERGDPAFGSFLQRALADQPGNGALWNAWIALLAGAGEQAAAADAARAAQAHFPDAVLRLIEADHAGLAGDDARAAGLLAQIPPMPGRARIAARHAVRTGDLAEAASLLDTARSEDPGDLGAWALTEVTWRALGAPRGAWLSGQQHLIAVTELAVPESDLAALAQLLRTLHRANARPLGQSVRGGTQTRGALFERRDRVIRTLVGAIGSALADYRAALPPLDPAHPLLRHRNAPLAAAGGWSVRLTAAGFHVAHLHAAGIVSSACYIVVPALDAGEREGWLELGRPPEDLRLPLDPLTSIAPQPGRLVLFPSFLYHGTRPFAAGERISVAFDAR